MQSQAITLPNEAISVQTPSPKSAKELSSKQQQAIALKFKGLSLQAISDTLGVKYSTLAHWFCVSGALYEPYKNYCTEIMNATPIATHTESISIAERLKQVAPQALENVIALSNGARREQVKMQASSDLLDRAGYAPVQKQLNVHAVEELNANDLNNLVDSLLGKHGLALNVNSMPVIGGTPSQDNSIKDESIDSARDNKPMSNDVNELGSNEGENGGHSTVGGVNE